MVLKFDDIQTEIYKTVQWRANECLDWR